MAVAYYQIDLSVRPAADGGGAFVIPKVLQTQDYQFILVKDGGKEAVIKMEASSTEIKKVAKDNKCKKVTKTQATKILKDYPAPRLKMKYRQTMITEKTEDDVERMIENFETDKKGKRILDTIQTVRSGFYLIDVPVRAKP